MACSTLNISFDDEELVIYHPRGGYIYSYVSILHDKLITIFGEPIKHLLQKGFELLTKSEAIANIREYEEKYYVTPWQEISNESCQMLFKIISMTNLGCEIYYSNSTVTVTEHVARFVAPYKNKYYTANKMLDSLPSELHDEIDSIYSNQH